jgi:DNA-binding protein H-NS
MAAKLDQYRKMKLEDLVEMERDLKIVIQEKKEAGIADFKKEMQERAKALGIDLDSVFGGGTKRRGPKGGSTVAPKYRNPDNHSETWTGRGREPRWMAKALKEHKHKTKDDFLIA